MYTYSCLHSYIHNTLNTIINCTNFCFFIFNHPPPPPLFEENSFKVFNNRLTEKTDKFGDQENNFYLLINNKKLLDRYKKLKHFVLLYIAFQRGVEIETQ